MTVWSNQSNLNKGEIDEALEGRIDTDLYYNALSKARNVLLTPQGGAKKRPGMKFLDSNPVATDIKLEKFSFNNETEYLLYFQTSGGGWRILIYKDDVLQTNINGSGNDYLETAGTLQIGTGLYYVQSANTAIVFGGGTPVIITRTSDTVWTANAAVFTNIPQYDFQDASSPTPVSEVQAVTFLNATASDRYKLSIDGLLSDEITWSSASTAENESRISIALLSMPNTGRSGITTSFFSGTQYRVTFAGESANGYGLIQGVPVLTVNAAFNAQSTVISPGTSRAEDAFSTARGWPKCGVFHQSRLWMGGTTDLPDSLWGSVIGDFFNFDKAKARDDESIFVTLQTSQVNDIQSMTSSRKLQVYTSGGEFYCPQDVITPTNVSFEAITNYGSKNIKPATLDGQVIMPQDSSRAVILMDVTNQYQPPASRNIGVLAPHLLNDIKRVVVARGNESSDANYIYLLNGDGDVACLSYLPSESVEGFSLWETSDVISDIAVVGTKLYFAVRRGTEVFLEVEEDTYTLDAAIAVSGQIVDLSHLIGLTTVEVVGDGAYLGEFTPSASVDLGRSVTSGFAGLAFRPRVRTMSLVSALANGSNYGQKKRIRRALISVLDTNSIDINGTTVPDKTIGVDVFSAPIPQTGLIRVRLRGYELEVFIDITQTAPLAFHLRSVGAEVKT